MAKRTVDIVFSLIGLLITSPLFLIVAILIRLDSKGPVFFRQERVGKDGKVFKIYKFRTMVENAERIGSRLTRKRDSRITQIGQILRWLKIDELPQLINVLKGEMSLVGPRPELPSIVSCYTDEEWRVLSVRPGIIGPSQILGRDELEKYPDGEEDLEAYYIRHILKEKLAIDLRYADNSSLFKDIGYLLRGLWVTISGSLKVRYILENRRRILLLLLDISLGLLSYSLAYLLRFDFFIPQVQLSIFLSTLGLMVLIRPPIFIYFGLYQGLTKYTDIREITSIFKAVTVGSLLILSLSFLLGMRLLPRPVIVIDWFLLNFFICGSRILGKILLQKRVKKRLQIKKNLLIVGAGDAGELILREIERRPELGYNPVGFIDDDLKKVGMMIHGVKVIGNRYDIPELASVRGIDEVLLAIPNVMAEEIREIVSLCRKAGLKCLMVPTIGDMITNQVHISKIRPVEIIDLLAREPVKIDISSVTTLLKGKRILVTGAGGSIGSEICRQVQGYEPEALILIDKTENSLYEMEYELNNGLTEADISFHLCNILDLHRLREIFQIHRPHIVIHAAAYKHVPLLEKNRDEAIKNNLYGTMVVADLSDEIGVETFVMISTDKAVNPTSFMGASKRMAELCIQEIGQRGKTKFVTVRFGNVLNSQGSVIPLFQRQIREGGPVTVTHPEIERYFMTIQEAVLLVLQAAAIGNSGEILVLDMGRQVKILDLAYELIRLSGFTPEEEIKISFIGLRPGEKLSEEIASKDEQLLPSSHKMIKVIRPKPIDLERRKGEVDRLLKWLRSQPPEELAREILMKGE